MEKKSNDGPITIHVETTDISTQTPCWIIIIICIQRPHSDCDEKIADEQDN